MLSIIPTTACLFLQVICFQKDGILASNRPTLFLKNCLPVTSLLSIFLHHALKSILWCRCWFTFLNNATQDFGLTFLSAWIHIATIVYWLNTASFWEDQTRLSALLMSFLSSFATVWSYALFTTEISLSSLTTSISALVNGSKPAGTKWLENPSRVTTTF